MAEVEKLKGWREEGIDTEELEKLLFTDLDAYNQLKIKMLTEKLERTSSEVSIEKGGTEPFSSTQRIIHPASKDDVITNSAMEWQKTTINPTLDNETTLISKTQDHSQLKKETVKVGGLLRIDKPKGRIALISICIISIVIVLSGIGSYLFLFKNADPPHDLSSAFIVSDLYPVSGSFFNISSTDRGKDVSHSWNIIPGDYEILKGGLTSTNISIYFTRMGEYRISHEVKMDDMIKAENKDITVSKRTIRVDRERSGDRAEYDVYGGLHLENVDDLFDFPDAADFRTMSMDFSSKDGSPSISSLDEGDPEFKDGYSRTYSTILRTLEHYLDITGSITDSKGTTIPFDGEIETDQQNHIDLFNRRLSRMDVTSRMKLDIQIQAGKTKHVDRLEKSDMFPDLSTEYRDLRLEDIASDRYISEDEFGTVVWGSSILKWKVEHVEIFKGTPCLNISLWMEQITLSDNDLEEFSMGLLLSDSLPVAQRSSLHMRSSKEVSNPYDIETIQSMKGFKKGTEPIIYGTLESYHENTTNIFSIYPDLVSEYDEKWTYTPEQGTKTSSIPSEFDAEKAISEFSDKPAFKNFVQGLTDPYALYCNFSSMEGRGELWKFSISDRSNPWGWNESVLKDSTVSSGLKSRIDPVKVGKSSIGGVLTFSGGETVIKRLMNAIDSSYGKALYGVAPGAESKLDMDESSIILIAEHRYPSIGILNQGTFERIDYGMVIRSSDNAFEACIDMHSGQLLYLYSNVKV